MADVEESRIGSLSLSVVLVVLQIPGIIINFVCASVFYRRLREQHKAFPYPILFAFTLSVIDGFICANYIVATSMNFFMRPNLKWGMILCLVQSYSFVFFFFGLRAITCLYIAAYNFIKLLFPFTQSPLPRRQLIQVLALNAVSLSSLGFVGQVLEFKYDSKVGRCISRLTNSELKSAHETIMVIRLIALVTFVHLYLFPYSATTFLYRKVLNNLKNHGNDEIKLAVYLELQKSYRLDGLLGLYFNSCINLLCFLIEFCDSIKVDMSTETIFVIYFCTVLYSTIYPYLCLTQRRIYRPVAETFGERFFKHHTASMSSGV